jgi:F-type H+-transporting ATPase subunit gamma
MLFRTDFSYFFSFYYSFFLVLNQINATKNIKKITSSMKMVSAAKLKGDENRLAVAEPFNAWTYNLTSEPMLLEDATFDGLPQKVLIVPFTTDKGLCGGVNSFISRGVRDMIKKIKEDGKDADVVVVGDKGRSQMNRSVGQHITRSLTEVLSPGTFGLASCLAQEIIAAGYEDYDAVVLVYNSFVNAAVYKQMYKVIKKLKTEAEGGEEMLMGEYEFDADKEEFVSDLNEFVLASQIFHSFMDGAAAEQSSRMTAMENASKNAGELIDKLTLRYNRARQARITTELIEIISGASALEG